MKNGFYLTIVAIGVVVIKGPGIDVVGDVQVGQVAELVALGEVIDGDDVCQTPCVERISISTT